jgi:predicted ester cyclase/predicted SnoaL-like aldol condensation-catalyzing enzyme
MKTQRLTTIIAILIAFCSSLSAQDKTKAEKTVRDLFVVMDAGQTDKFGEYLSADFKIMNPFLPSPQPLQAFQGIIQGQKTGFPDLKHEVISIVSDGKNVITKGVFRGTNSASFMGMPATGNKVNATFLVWDEMDTNNKIKMRKVEFDAKGFEAQLMAGIITAEDLKKQAKIAYKALENHDIDKFISFIADDAIDYGGGMDSIKGKIAIGESIKSLFGAFPDYKLEVKEIATSGSKVFVQNTFKGTQTKPLFGIIPATNKMVDWADTDILEFDAKGKIKAHWLNNPNGLVDQLGYHVFTNPNTKILMGIYENFGKGNVAGIQASCADNVVFDVTDNPFIKNPKVYKNNQEMAQFFSDLATSGETTKFEPVKFFADGDDVVSIINVGYKSNMNGKNVASTFAHHFTFENGKVVKFKEITTKPLEVNNMSSMK